MTKASNKANESTSRKKVIRKIVVIDPYGIATPQKSKLDFNNFVCEIEHHRINFDVQLIIDLIVSLKETTDIFVMHGIPSGLSFENERINFKQFERFKKAAGDVPVFTGERLRELYARWTIEKSIKKHPHLFRNKRILFHVYTVMPIAKVFKSVTENFSFLDPLAIFSIPKKLTSLFQLKLFFKKALPLVRILGDKAVNPSSAAKSKAQNAYVKKAVKDSDIFVTFSKQLNLIEDFSIFVDKLIIVDALTPEMKVKLSKVNTKGVLEYMPYRENLEKLGISSFSILVAVIYLDKIYSQSHLEMDEFMIDWIEKYDLKPKSFDGFKEPSRVSFIIHALSQDQLWNAEYTKALRGSPQVVKDSLEKVFSKFPVLPYGQITGIKSQFDGSEVIVDLYALPATPKVLLKMNEETVYRHLVKAINKSAERGSLLSGLGAYTKVVGDAGVTVNRRSTIPVTTGNSYSTASTLWAAAEMVGKMNFVKTSDSGRIFGKAMIIGASGSIGRVSSLMVAKNFSEVCLVAPRIDKLFEIKEEIEESTSDVKVTITKDANAHIEDMDLIITATSSQNGKILDISKVKPGAVICDCSRPLDISKEEAASRPDVLVIESGEIDLPGDIKMNCELGLPNNSVYACLAETALLGLEGRYEPFSISRDLSLDRVLEIYEIGIKHGAKLSAIQCHSGVVTDEMIEAVRKEALKKLSK